MATHLSCEDLLEQVPSSARVPWKRKVVPPIHSISEADLGPGNSEGRSTHGGLRARRHGEKRK